MRDDLEPCRATLLLLDAVEFFPSLEDAISCVSGNGEYLDKDLAFKDQSIAHKLDWCDRFHNFARVFFDNNVSDTCEFLREHSTQLLRLN